MDWTIDLNRESGFLTVSVRGPWDMAEGMQALRAGWNHQADSGLQCVVWDVREVSASHVSSGQLRELAHRLLTDRPQLPSTTAAIVVSRDFEFGMGRMMEAFLGDGPVDFQVFRDLQEARQWLGEPDAHGNPILPYS